MKMLQKSRENADVQKESIVNKYAFKRSIFSVCTYIHGIMRKKGYNFLVRLGLSLLSLPLSDLNPIPTRLGHVTLI